MEPYPTYSNVCLRKAPRARVPKEFVLETNCPLYIFVFIEDDVTKDQSLDVRVMDSRFIQGGEFAPGAFMRYLSDRMGHAAA